MSFGYSVGDFIAVGELTWKVYRAVKDAPEKFGFLAGEVSTLNVLLRDLKDDAADPNSLLNRRGGGRRDALMGMIHIIENEMKELHRLVLKYHHLTAGKKHLFDRLLFGVQDLETRQTAISNQISYINTFRQSLFSDSLSKIERILEDGIKGLNEKKRAPSIVSVYQNNDEKSWTALKEDLARSGITTADIEAHREAIKDYINILIANETSPEDASDDNSTRWDGMSRQTDGMALSDESENESADSGNDPRDSAPPVPGKPVKPSTKSESIFGNATVPSPPTAAKTDTLPKPDETSSASRWTIRVRCPDRTFENIELHDFQKSNTTVEDLQTMVEIRKGYPIGSSRLLYEGPTGLSLDEVPRKALVKDARLYDGVTVYRTTRAAAMPGSETATMKETPPASPGPRARPCMAIAIYDFKSVLSTDLSFRKGDMIEILQRTSHQNDWWTGKLAGKTGKIPGNYVRIESPEDPATKPDLMSNHNSTLVVTRREILYRRIMNRTNKLIQGNTASMP